MPCCIYAEANRIDDFDHKYLYKYNTIYNICDPLIILIDLSESY